jgi:ribosomal protein S12 methylthiotransferase
VEGAAANALPDHVPDALREERRARLMKLQEDISARRLRRHVGKTVQVLVDSIEAGGAVARSAADAPEIDGIVHVPGAAGLKPGAFAAVRVTRTDVHDMWAEVE